MSSAKDTNQDTFSSDVLGVQGTPVLVDFWAPWCGPCQQQGPILDEVAAEMGDKVKIYKVNVDEANELAGQYGIMSIPALKIFKDGEVVDAMVGVHQKDQLIEKLNAHM